MVTYQIKSNPNGQYYLPKAIRSELGQNLDLICDSKAAIIFTSGVEIETILESLELIICTLKQRLRLTKKNHASSSTVNSSIMTKKMEKLLS